MSNFEEIFPDLAATTPSPDNASFISEDVLEKLLLAADFAATSSGSGIRVEEPETVTMKPLEMSSPAGTVEPQAAITHNGCYTQSGSFTVGQAGRLVIRWRQAPPIKDVKYPWRAQAIAYEIFKDGKRLTGWKLAGPAYLNEAGHVHLPVIGSDGVSRLFRSPQSFFSEDFKALVKALEHFRVEYKHIEKHGWKNLPFAFRNKDGKIVATKSTLIMGALITKTGPEAIANSKKESRPFADRIHDNVLRISDNKTMGGLVQRMLGAAGLQLHDHPTRGRSLIVGGRSAAGATPGDTQYETNAGLVSGAPLRPEFIDGLTRIADRMDGRTDPTDREVDEVLRLYNQQFVGIAREAFLDRMASYLAGQQRIFPNGVAPRGVSAGVAGIRYRIEMLMTATTRFREGRFTLDGYHHDLREAAEMLEVHGHGGRGRVPPNGMTGRNIVNLLLQMPGFEITQNARRNNARELLVDAAERWRALRPLVNDELNPDLWTQILLMAGYLAVFVFSGGR